MTDQIYESRLAFKLLERVVELLEREPELSNTEPGFLDRKYRNAVKKLVNDFEDAANVDKLSAANAITKDVKNGLKQNMEKLIISQDVLDVS